MARGSRSPIENLKRFFATIIGLAIIVFIAINLFFYFMYGINAIGLAMATNDIKKSYTVSPTATTADYSSYVAKMSSTSMKISFTSDEITAYLMKAETSSEYDIISVEFDGDKLEAVIKYDMTAAKKSVKNMSKHLPNDAYIKVTSKIMIEDSNSYSIKPVALNIQNLNKSKSKQIFSALSVKEKKYKCSTFNKHISSSIMSMLVDDGIFNTLQSTGATGFGIEAGGFAVYFADLNITKTITYLNTKDVENPNPVKYTIASGIITLEDLSLKGYVFNGWYDGDTKVTEVDSGDLEDKVFTAKWSIREYSITYKNTKDVTNTNAISYDINTPNITLKNLSLSGYVFDGWYIGSEKVTEIDTTILEDLVIEAHWTIIEYSITYKNTKDAANTNPVKYTVETKSFTLSSISANAYVFDGWYYGSLKITNIDTASLSDIELTAKWTPKQYNIKYVLNGGINPIDNPLTYTIETEDFEILNPTKEDSTFIGWTDGETTTDYYVVSKGTCGDITLTALFTGSVNTISLVSDGEVFHTFELEKNTVLTEAILDEKIKEAHMSGYYADMWYTDTQMLDVYGYDTPIKTDSFIYCSLSYIVDDITFYPYIDKFESGINSGNINIVSYDMLKAYIEYVMFYDVTKKVNLNISYSIASVSAMSEISAAKADVKNFSNVSRGVGFSTGGSGRTLGYYYATTNTDEFATLTYDATKEYIAPQQGYALEKKITPTRSGVFDSFNRNKATKYLDCYTSSQLVVALSNGYVPICHDSALVIYDKAKTVLRSIINDEMSDVEKLSMIYEWISLNTSYDVSAAADVNDTLSSTEALKYRSWYAEGVFLDGIAVCEGYAKAFMILSNIENIPSIYVTGNGHAWNKAYVNDNWYVFDATHSDVQMRIGDAKYEVFSYAQFMITDAQKAAYGYETEDYTWFAAEDVYDYYDHTQYTSASHTFSLLFTSSTNVKYLADKIKKYSSTTTLKTVTIEIGGSYTIGKFKTDLYSAGISSARYSEAKSLLSGNATYIIMI